MEEKDKQSYSHILKSTGVIGGSQVINILIGIVRVKIVAVLLGPFGYGIMSSLQSTIDLMRQATSFGINFSAVREIAQFPPEDKTNINRILLIIRRWALYTGLLGVVVTIALCYPLSLYAFDTTDYAMSIAMVSIVLFITSISAAQSAMLQGFRQLRKMALTTIWGAAIGTIAVVPIYYVWGISGIVPAMIIVALIALLFTWIYTRKIKINKIQMTFKQTIKGGISMAKLGLYLVLTSFIVTLIMYSVRAFLVRELNMDAVGWFQSAWSVSNVYIGVVLSAMGADFFPRLSAIHTNIEESNKLINQQLEMVLLIITPLLLGLIGAAELVINILYSSKFSTAIPVLQWQLAGGVLTVISWCLGVMFLSKNKGNYALLTESIWGGLYLGFVMLTWDYFGFLALGIGYVVSSGIKTGIVILSVKKIGKFQFSKQSLRDVLVVVFMIMWMLGNISFVAGPAQYILSVMIFVSSVWYSYKRLSSVIDIKAMINKLLRR